VLFAYLGAVTNQLEFSTEIIILPQRQTVLFAKQAAEVDYLTGGRLRLGLGIGWNALEFEALNEDFGNRGRRVVEQIKVMRALWTQEVVEFHGKWHQIDRAGLNPLPAQRPIPIWIGGSAEPVLKRTAAIGDGWMPLFRPAEEASIAMVGRLRQYVREAGRAEAEVGIEGRINLGDGTPEAWQHDLEDWRALRVSHVGVATSASLKTPDEHIEALRRFKELVH
jgi:probable F420-dependent oxidoreductase